ncbi:hypothetical protein TNIN_66381, partial [Trichonephila inaurata madagascariensis]
QVLAVNIKMRKACMLILCAAIFLSVIQNNRGNASFFKRSPILGDSDDSEVVSIRVERSPQNDDDTSTPQPSNTDTSSSSSDDDFDDQIMLIENSIFRRLEHFS